VTRPLTILLATATLASCGVPAPLHSPAAGYGGSTAAAAAMPGLLRLHGAVRVPAIETRRFTHAQLWSALEPLVDASPHLQREEIGRSAEGRTLQSVRFGGGPVRVLLWSQMHGDESTATLSLLDLFHHLSRSPEDPLARRLRERLTLVAIPMLNPDGAERFQRRSAHGIDLNRDARALVTPEARVLREAHRALRPDFGFNLHDQNPRITVGNSGRIAAISLLAPPFDEARSDNPVRARAKRLAAVLRDGAEVLVPGHVARYDDSFNPRAFGDLMQSWGTSTVLIEAGGWRGDEEKQFLRAVNFALLLRALDAIATGEVDATDPFRYESMLENGPLAVDLLVRGGTLVAPGVPPLRADLSATAAGGRLSRTAQVTEIGDLRGITALDTLDVSGLYLHFDADPGSAGLLDPPLRPGMPLTFTARRGPDSDSESVLRVRDGVREPR
jgi:hypothetical protein